MLKLFKITAILGLMALSFITALVCAVVLYFNPKLPPIDALKDSKLQVPLRIYSAQGSLIGEYGEQFRTPVRSEDIPEQMVQAFLAAEDDNFLEHGGIDIAGLLRAAGQLLATGSIQSGGSTITMQVARNYFLSSEQTFIRKFKEILLAIKIERQLSKSEILELYVNKIYLGKRAYGVQAAAAIYYDSQIQDINLAQISMIAGLPKAPSIYNPITNPSRALTRRNWILGRMLKLGYIDADQFNDATSQPITASNYGPRLELSAGHAAELARRFALDKFGNTTYTDGYSIYTTIDDDAQISAEAAIKKGLIDYTARHGYRGPEQRLGDRTLEEQTKALESLRTVNGLQAALITNISASEVAANLDDDQNSTEGYKLTVILSGDNADTIDFLWDAKNNELQEFISENRKRSPVKNIDKLLQVGDIIRLRKDEGRYLISQLPSASASLIAINPSNGSIKAIIGGFDDKQSQFNRATQAYRQPGSNFKPFIYAAALENGFTAASIINDAPVVFADSNLEEEWRPENASGKFHGPTTLRKALYLSRNLVSVRILRELGVGKAINYLERYNLSGGKLPRNLSLALGSHALTPIEVASLYSVLANGGYKVEPFLVKEIRDRSQQVIFRANPAIACSDCKAQQPGLLAQAGYEEAEELDDILATEPKLAQDQPTRIAEQVMSPEVAFIIDDIVRDAIKRGTGRKALALKRGDIAGKTGTTNGPTDAWFSGYHPNLVATAWLGFDNNEKLGRNEYGGTAALPIWIDFMSSQLPKLPYADRRQPDSVVAVRIDSETGLRANAQTPDSQFEYFTTESVPPETETPGNVYQQQQIDVFNEDLF